MNMNKSRKRQEEKAFLRAMRNDRKYSRGRVIEQRDRDIIDRVVLLISVSLVIGAVIYLGYGLLVERQCDRNEQDDSFGKTSTPVSKIPNPYIPPGELSENRGTSYVEPAKFTVARSPVSATMIAAGSINALIFYDGDEQVGRLTWYDTDGDGVLNLGWDGISLDRSGKLFIDWLKQSGMVCACPQKGDARMSNKE